MQVTEHHGDLVVEGKNQRIKMLLEKAPTMCGYCKIRPAEHDGVGGPKCTYCEDALSE